MAKSFISKRIIFSNSKSQIDFLNEVRIKLNKDWKTIAKEIEFSDRAVRDWARGKYTMPYRSAIYLAKKAKINLPQNTKIRSLESHLKIISKKGGQATFEKYGTVGGNKDIRMAKWKKWWKVTGQKTQNGVTKAKVIRTPRKDEKLAELVGIMIGDGGITPYHSTVTLNSKDDLKYSVFVFNLLKSSFAVKPKIYIRKSCSALDIVVHRKNISQFYQSIGLPIGNKIKQDIDIPRWIKRSRKLQIACVRGLVDTDGSFFTHCYKVKGRIYCYNRISFASRSFNLLKSVEETLKKLGFSVRITKNRDEIRIEKQSEVIRYIDLIETNNPKHQEKINKWKVAPNGKAAVC